MSGLSAVPAAVRMAVDRRSCGRCERCGSWGTERHHRKGGSMRKFSHRVPNLLKLCSTCHRLVTRFPRVAYQYGWSINGMTPPEQVPVLALGAIDLLLGPTGGYLAGSQPLRHLGEVQDLLAAVRMQRVGPADAGGTVEASVPASGVVEHGGLGQPGGGLGDPVRAPRVEAGALIFTREQIGEVLPHLSQGFKARYRIGYVPEPLGDLG